ncbi:hypothetical protein COV53_06005 [Candidatus Gottesmanbacteria bacterium CG11_big_fil_rev_8_21_14_0_20_37_11]|uniref:Methyltransferase type 11 domain-containing protein n=3 Tax=Candidatus Gottesmaniibacteriota TaxID=1752720 RepID=A0A2M7RRV3_9BACT|nr:MAG: hypothetical protein AUJ73_02310 [Candidatus Gottesmanbacteria bacterium CG1_02_37_22]PIP32392.1 MAG: hypothetical protein COX23_04945 [Candidatus Gottesmanbacteria bacterium CG23_combo_of_CG06-09_8_20_14_all_37_19]PIR07854.1 MAG: hypothetical protein COV53_06005 [Candidatus Gottesmanbacteria bacterium CG11_big_fil_rev_8_21_14_0_20_37_11]PIZ03037.1 MAG: hypothetical protein COY59_01565 [Candidatus Gottesmanbacteria bacterium CG_4_10_14_0_8_um_filter_37_24]
MNYSKSNITNFIDVDIELYFATEILKLKSLHYGYWKKGEKLTIKNLQNAQKRYTDVLTKNIPKGVEAILDVGSGIGDNARALTKIGYAVTALSPDKEHEKYYKKLKKVKFQNITFEDFNENRKYDLVLMSESQNYFDAETGLKQSARYLKNGGYLLISGKFRIKNTPEYENIINVEGDYIRKALKYSFMLEKQLDITDNILPTLKLARLIYRDYYVPTKHFLIYYLDSLIGIKYRIIKFISSLILSDQIIRISNLEKYYLDYTDPEKFRKFAKYSVLLFRYWKKDLAAEEQNL